MTPERWRQVGALYEAARAQPAEARAAFLAEACAGDEDLRREVRSFSRAVLRLSRYRVAGR